VSDPEQGEEGKRLLFSKSRGEKRGHRRKKKPGETFQCY